MLKVQAPIKYSKSEKILAPEVFIDSIEIEKTKISVFFHIKDNEPSERSMPRWLKNDFILNNLYIVIICNGIEYKETLNSLKKSSKLKNYTIHGSYSFPFNDQEEVSLVAYTSNQDKTITSKKTFEPILRKEKLSAAIYNNNTYNAFSKIKNLRLLSLQDRILDKKYIFNIEKDLQKYKETNNLFSRELYISYLPNRKQANLGYFFDLELFLLKNSHSYRLLSQFKSFKNLILLNSKINENSTIFYKKVHDVKEEYQKINSKINIFKLNADPIDKKYLITTSDEENLNSEYRKFLIKVSLEILDYSNFFLKSEIIDKFPKIISFISLYKQKLEITFSNTSIPDHRAYFFEQEYEKNFQNIIEAISFLSNVYSLYSEMDSLEYQNLFLNLFHPLTTRPELLERLITTTNKLERSFKNIISEINDIGDPNTPFFAENNNKFEFEFKKNVYGRENNFINYDFDGSNGIEIFSPKESYSFGIQILDEAELNNRKKQEIFKYFGTEDLDKQNSLKHLSAYYLYLGNVTYNLLKFEPSSKKVPNSLNSNTNIDELINKIKFLNENKIYTSFTTENLFFNLAYRGIYIKSISKKLKNSPVNRLNIGILFDTATSSQKQSSKYLEETKINELYYLVDDLKILSIEQAMQNEAAFDSLGTNYPYTITPERLSDPKEKTTIVTFYNTLYGIKEVLKGTNYSLYELEESYVNEVFYKKLQIFNKYYIISHPKKNVRFTGGFIEINKDVLREMSSNIYSYNLNRNLQEQEINLNLSDL